MTYLPLLFKVFQAHRAKGAWFIPDNTKAAFLKRLL